MQGGSELNQNGKVNTDIGGCFFCSSFASSCLLDACEKSLRCVACHFWDHDCEVIEQLPLARDQIKVLGSCHFT